MPEALPTARPTAKRQVEVSPAVVPVPSVVNPGEDETNVGNKLLKMMGWKEGTGLGSSAEGRVEPMYVSVSVPGL